MSVRLRLVKSLAETQTQLGFEITIDEWLTELEASELAETTIAGRIWYVNQLAIWLGEMGLTHPAHVDEVVLKQWLIFIRDKIIT